LAERRVLAAAGVSSDDVSLIGRRCIKEGSKMKKPVLSIEEPEPKKIIRADRPPAEAFALVVDGHFKTEFDTVDAAEASGRKLKSAHPMLQIEIYDAEKKTRALLS
jgi:hypothetical protein